MQGAQSAPNALEKLHVVMQQAVDELAEIKAELDQLVQAGLTLNQEYQRKAEELAATGQSPPSTTPWTASWTALDCLSAGSNVRSACEASFGSFLTEAQKTWPAVVPTCALQAPTVSIDLHNVLGGIQYYGGITCKR